MDTDSLLYCAYAIAVFDLCCSVLFAVLCLCKIFSHLSWLTIFATVFGVFWFTLIILLISGIYRRNARLVRAWLLFSCVGIFIEISLIIYAFFKQSTFQIGIAGNSTMLCLGIFIETIFVFIIYQFYLMVSRCSPCRPQCNVPRCEAAPAPPSRAPTPPPLLEEADCPPITHKSSRSYRCHILQSRAQTSPYVCGSKHNPYNPLRMNER